MSYFKEIDPEKEYKHSYIWDYVYERDNGFCQLCGKNNGSEQHHLMPLGNGGKTKTNNIILLCRNCHTGKGHYFNREDKEKLRKAILRNERNLRDRIV